jgi:hypothetical protein
MTTSSARLVIAAANTPNGASRADVVCTSTGITGANDDTTIANALAALTAPSEVALLEGDYYFNSGGVDLANLSGYNIHGVAVQNNGDFSPAGGTVVHVGSACTSGAFHYNATDVTGTAVTFNALAGSATSCSGLAGVGNGTYFFQFADGEWRSVTVSGSTGTWTGSGGGALYASAAGITSATAHVYPYANNPAFLNSCLRGFQLSNMAFDTATYGVKIGSLFHAGALCSYFHNLTVGCKQASQAWNWGLYFENTCYSGIEDVIMLGPTSSAMGLFYFGSSSGGAPSGIQEYDPTNSYIKNINVDSSCPCRGVVFEARAPSAYINDLNCVHISSILAQSLLTIPTATFSTTGPNITLSSATGLMVGMPVTVGTQIGSGANGFTPNVTYYIVSLSGTTARLSYTKNGAPITTNANGTSALYTYGW